MEGEQEDKSAVALPIRFRKLAEDQFASSSRSISPLTITTPGIIPVTGVVSGAKGRQKSSSVQQARRLHLQIEKHLQSRAGSVLNHRSMLKVDQYPLKQKDALNNASVLPISISGAKNLRQSPASRVYGVAQPTIHGIRGVLNLLRCGREHANDPSGEVSSPGGSTGQQEVLWINMREEPILFINGRCIVLRETDEPFRNMTALKGISKERVEALEWRLKEDVVAEASLNGGNIMLHTEVKKREIQPCWEAVRLDQIKTTEEVFFQFRMEGYKVKYYRWPTTPEESPSKKLFDLLLSCIMESSETTNIVFNCQTGRGRSTFGMVAARLVQMWRGPETLMNYSGLPKRRRSSIKVPDSFQPVKVEEAQKLKPIPRVLSGHSLKSIEAQLDMDTDPAGSSRSSLVQPRSTMDDTSKSLMAGWYQPVLQVIRLLQNGREAKSHVDHFIDECTHLVNLRELIFRFRKKATLRPNEAKIFRFQTMRAGTALIRYILLILFDAYLCEQVQEFLSPDTHRPGVSQSQQLFSRSFENWVDNRPGVIQILTELQRNPQAALESISFTALPFEISNNVGEDQRKVLEAIASRRGSMLNTDTILKLDHYPGAEGAAGRSTSETVVEIHGAANFRTVRNTRLSGVCTPTLEAAFRMFRYIENEYKAISKIVWSNLREEPLIYINKRPFSLRSIGKPFRNVDTFSDIDPEQLEAAEIRLKKDVLTEAAQYAGRVLVHVETEERELQSVWEDVSGEDDVLTPRELFEYVKEAQLDIDYQRLPIYPERPPSPEDVDSLIERVRQFKSDASAHFLFNCQMGRGRSTMAMIIAFLELMPTGTNSNNSVLSMSSAEKFVSIEVEEMESFEDSLRPADKDEDTQDSSSIDSNDGTGAKRTEPEYSVILSLVRVLRNGVSAKRWADHVIDRCGAVENIRGNVEVYARRAAKARTEDQSEDYLQRALVYLRRYFLIITIAAYEGDYFAELTTKSYSAWYNSRPELTTLFGQIVDKRSIQAAALDSVLSTPPDEANEFAAMKEDTETDKAGQMQEILEYIASRSGSVLIRGSIVKSDHFPGCNRIKNAAITIQGAPNLRQVPYESKDPASGGWNVHGTGITTVEGLKELLDHLIATDKERGITNTEVCWINLREEPILYINGRPFVLRKLEHPFGNLEHTGISRERVENMEARLKLDVIQEVIENGDGRFLLHDEDHIGLTPAWEKVDISPGSTSLLTPTELYEYLRQEGYNVQCFRVPITDEQAPKLSDYDKIFNIVSSVPDDAKIIVNCQMGRGRTTTGLVVVLAVMLWQHRELEVVLQAVAELMQSGHKFRSKLRGKERDGLSAEELTYLKGEFKSALSSTTVLHSGMKAKAITDAIIDVCDTMQNIREAIYDLKLTCEKPNLSAMQLAASQGRGAHYVIRYCQLIQFVSYLLSMDPNSVAVKPMQSFLDWVQDRPELRNATRNASFPP